ncbi:MAG: DUF3102 domain-containing protein [Angelakisella sp.]
MENTIVAGKQEAYELHQYILAQGKVIGQSINEIGRCLKQMRDEKLFIQLGHETFEDYTTVMLGLKQRQAYNYIQAFEDLGSQFLETHSQLGISRLLVLAAVPVAEREDFVTENNVAAMTVRELEELTKKYTAQSEQMSLLQTELKEIQSRPIDVAVQLPDNKTLEKIRTEVKAEVEKAAKAEAKEQQKKAAAELTAIKTKAALELADAKKKANADIDAAKATARQDAEAAAAKKLQASLSELENSRAEALARAAEMESKLALAANNELVIVNLLFEEIQTAVQKAATCIKTLEERDADTAKKLRTAAIGMIDQLKGLF